MWALTLHLLAIARGVTLGGPRLCPNPAENSVTCRHLVHVRRIPGGSCRTRTWSEHRITQGIPPKISADNLLDRSHWPVQGAYGTNLATRLPAMTSRRRVMPHVTPLHADDPRRVGRYRLTGRIAGMPADDPAHLGSAPNGFAGMPADGPVYLGQSPEGGEVAVRLLEADWIGDGAERDRFAAEAKAACRVAPFCAAQFLGAGFESDRAFLVSEYVAGPSLEEFVAEEGPWEGRDLLALAIGTATGLAAIHQAG